MSNNHPHTTPPKLAIRLLQRFIKDELAEEVLGDLEEKFYKTTEGKTIGKARKNYWYQVIQYVRPFALKKLRIPGFTGPTPLDMYKHYLKISWRNLVRSKVFSSIKIGGFAIGIAACILIALYIQHEASYDQHYADGDRIYRIANNYQSADGGSLWVNLHGPLKPVLEESFPEMEKVSRVVLWRWDNAGENHIRPVESRNNIYEEGFFYADPELLEILEMPMVYGSSEQALTAPNSMVITKSKADKYFPNENPVGKQMVLNDTPKDTYIIGGVIEDFPSTSHLQGDFILTLAERKTGPGTSGWCCTNYTYYIKLTPAADKLALEEKMVALRDTYLLDKFLEAGMTDVEDLKKHQSYYLQPIRNAYLNPEDIYDDQVHGSHDMLWIFGTIAVIILVIACLNFINLSTARSIKRAKEVGLRKVVGSVRSSLIYQYLAESIFYSVLSVLVAALIAYLALPLFNNIAAKSLIIPWTSAWFLPSLLSGAVLIGVLSGLYPAFYLSHFNPIEALKGRATSGVRSAFFRSAMVVFQFTATVILIIGALAMHSQFEHYMNKSLGFEKDQVINLLGVNTLAATERDVLKDELLRLSTVESASLGDYLPVSGASITNFGFQVEERKATDLGFEAARWLVDEDYIKTMGMELVAGRNFTKRASDKEGIIINEHMAQQFGLEDPVGTWLVDMFDGRYQVIGVVKDFHFESLITDVRPLAMVLGKGESTLSLKVKTEDMQGSIAAISAVWKDIKPNQPIRYSFMNDRFALMYSDFSRIKQLFLTFSVLAIIVACLGLFALSAYTIEQRSKEISVRKVLGASVSKIFGLLATDFIKLVVIASLIAIPIGWYLMDNFLNDLANRIVLSWPIFLIATLAAFIIALITISYESIKAALVNPATRLRSE